MANKEIHELTAAAVSLPVAAVIAGVVGVAEAKKYTGAEITALEAIARAAQDDAIILGVGLNADGTYAIPPGTTYLGASTSTLDALDKLDTAIGTFVVSGIYKKEGFLSNAEVQNLGTFQEMVAAPGVGKVIDVIDCVLYIQVTTQLDVGSQLLYLEFEGGDATLRIHNADVETAASSWFKMNGYLTTAMDENTAVGFRLSADANPIAGNAIIRFKALYRIADRDTMISPI